MGEVYTRPVHPSTGDSLLDGSGRVGSGGGVTSRIPVVVSLDFWRTKLGGVTPPGRTVRRGVRGVERAVSLETYAAMLHHAELRESDLAQLWRLTGVTVVGRVVQPVLHARPCAPLASFKVDYTALTACNSLGYAAAPLPPPLTLPITTETVTYAIRLYRNFCTAVLRRRAYVPTGAQEIADGLVKVAGISSRGVALADYYVFACALMPRAPLGKVLRAAPKLAGPFHGHRNIAAWNPPYRVPGTDRLHAIAHACLYEGARLPADWDDVVADAITKKAAFATSLASLAAQGKWVWPTPPVPDLDE